LPAEAGHFGVHTDGVGKIFSLQVLYSDLSGAIEDEELEGNENADAFSHGRALLKRNKYN
jgi:hypothetical protein